MNFDYGTVQSYVPQIFGSNQDIGKGISDMLVDKLLKDGKYRLVERSALDKILAEQNFSNSDRADSNTAAKIGKVLGVDAIIIGSITQFGRDDQHTNVGGGGYGLGRFGLGGVGTSKAKAVVGITARVINVSTGEILASVQGQGRIDAVEHFPAGCGRRLERRRWRRSGHGQQQLRQHDSGRSDAQGGGRRGREAGR